MVKLMIGIVGIAFFATLIGMGIAFLMTPWPYLIGGIGFGIYYFVTKQKEERNKV